MSSLRDAFKAVKNDIVTVPMNRRPAPARKSSPERQKTFVNGFLVQWESPEDNGPKIPYIQTDKFYTQYPTKAEDIKLPEGTKMASYNAAKHRVEFFDSLDGDQKPIRYVNDARHEPLPLPRFMNDLERVEEIFEIDFETGEVVIGMNVDILPEGTHWKLRLQEYEAFQIKHGVSEKHISFRLQKHLKNLEATRGVTVEMLAEPVPQNVLDAIEFSEAKQRAAVGGK